MNYKIIVSEKLEKQLKKISNKIAKRIIVKIENLSVEPRPHDVKKLKGKNLYRIREGQYRIVYKIEDKMLIVLIVDVAHRKEIYKNLS